MMRKKKWIDGEFVFLPELDLNSWDQISWVSWIWPHLIIIISLIIPSLIKRLSWLQLLLPSFLNSIHLILSELGFPSHHLTLLFSSIHPISTLILLDLHLLLPLYNLRNPELHPFLDWPSDLLILNVLLFLNLFLSRSPHLPLPLAFHHLVVSIYLRSQFS